MFANKDVGGMFVLYEIRSTDLKSDSSEVAVESLEIAHEGLTIANG